MCLCFLLWNERGGGEGEGAREGRGDGGWEREREGGMGDGEGKERGGGKEGREREGGKGEGEKEGCKNLFQYDFILFLPKFSSLLSHSPSPFLFYIHLFLLSFTFQCY